MKKTLKSILGVSIGLIIVGSLIFLGCGTVTLIPDRAIVYLDTNKKIYYSPLGLTQQEINTSGLKKSTLKEAKNLDYKMSEEDNRNEYFIQDEISGFDSILALIGIHKPLHEVDADGNWLY